EYTDLNRKAIERILLNAPKGDTLTIIATGDTQRWYDEVSDLVKSANEHKADFMIVNGDISDFGLKDEFVWINKIMTNLNKPYIGVIGNHDLSGNGSEVYTKMYGALNQSFIVNRVKFILINTNSREYNFNGHVPDIPWLEEQLQGNDFDHAIVVSHIQPFDGDFDKSLEAPFATTLSQSGKVIFSLHAHQHHFSEMVPYEDGLHYLTSTSMNERMYLIIKIVNNQFFYEKVYF
ncbi:MAG TPA: metallophosphoesterase, partial [Cyclobacteriaceae bacterium]